MIAPISISQELPIDLSEVKEYLRVDHAEEDKTISQLIRGAQSIAEDKTNLKLTPGNYYYYLDHICGSSIELPINPVESVEKIEYLSPTTSDFEEWEKEGNWELMNQYTMPAYIHLTNPFPTVASSNSKKKIRITFSAGYKKGEIDPAIISAMYLDIVHRYDRREDGQPFNNLPKASELIYRQKRVFTFK